jgi:hypothetical protein
MREHDIGGYGDPHTYGYCEPYQDQDEEDEEDTRDGSEWEGFEYEE